MCYLPVDVSRKFSHKTFCTAIVASNFQTDYYSSPEVDEENWGFFIADWSSGAWCTLKIVPAWWFLRSPHFNTHHMPFFYFTGKSIFVCHVIFSDSNYWHHYFPLCKASQIPQNLTIDLFSNTPLVLHSHSRWRRLFSTNISISDSSGRVI